MVRGIFTMYFVSTHYAQSSIGGEMKERTYQIRRSMRIKKFFKLGV